MSRLQAYVQCVLLAFLYVLAGSLCSFAAELATLTGYVTDPSGLRVPQCRLQITKIDTNISYFAESNDAGLYRISALPAGNYRVIVQKTGFKTITKQGIELHVQDVIALNFQLELGSVAESVTVESGAPLLNTEAVAVSTVVDRRFVENMPLNGRSFQTLLMLAPGVVLTPASAPSPGQFSVNGQRADANYFTVDGVSANIGVTPARGLGQAAGGGLPGFTVSGATSGLVSVDAMEEFRIQTSSFAPEFGRSPGGQVSLVTRSGSNRFHGTLFDYFRNDALDANNWFAAHSGQPKPRERQNDFGGVLGGPILKDRTFFFFSYEGLRLRQPAFATTSVPSLASRQSASSAILPFLAAFSRPNGPDLGAGLAQFATGYSIPATLDAYSIRVDHLITPRLSIFGRYNYAPSSTTTRGRGTVLSVTTPTEVNTHTATLGITQSISQRIANEIRANYSNVKANAHDIQDSLGGAVPLSDALMFPQGANSAQAEFLLTINGVGTLFGGQAQTNEQRQFNVVDNLSLSVRSHQLKFGADYRWGAPIADIPSYLLNVFFLGVTGSSGILSGVPPFGGNISAQQPTALLQQNLSLFAQDSWKMSRRLNLTYGVRWDVNPALKGKSSESQPFAATGADAASTIGIAPAGTSLYQTTYTNFAPRIGIAYELNDDPAYATVLKGGFGVFFDLGSGSLGQLIGGFPFTTTKNLGTTPFPFTGQQAAAPVISKTPPVRSQWTVADPNLKLPRTYQWNVSVEQSLGHNQIISATYVASVGRQLLRQDNFSAPNSTFASVVSVTRNSATSDYDALQLKFQRRLTSGLQALASYTWSHSLDNASNDFATFTPASIADPNIDRGNSDFDVRHSVTGAVSYDVPFPSSPGLLRAFLEHWSLDSFVTARSALPVNLVGSTFVVRGAQFTSRPNVVNGVPPYLYSSLFPGGKAINRAAFTSAPTGQQGNFTRNSLRGFGVWQGDLTVRRQFSLGDKVGLQFRAEFFNIFNHPNFGDPGANNNGTNSLTSPLFGKSTQILASSLGSGGILGGFNPLYQVGGPRSIQVALKLQF